MGRVQQAIATNNWILAICAFAALGVAAFYAGEALGYPFVALAIVIPVGSVFLVPSIARTLSHVRGIPKQSFTWWQGMWLLLFLSGLVFRERTGGEISDSPIDGWALYRIACVSAVAFILLIRLTLKRIPPFGSMFSGPVAMFGLYPLMAIFSTAWSVRAPWTFYKSAELLVDVAMLASIVVTVRSVTEYRRLANWTWFLLGLLVISTWVGAIVDPKDGLYGDPSLRFSPLPLRLSGVAPIVACNEISEISAILALVCLCRYLEDPRSKPMRSWYGLVFAASIVTVIVAQTRAVVFALLVGVLLLLLITRRYSAALITAMAAALTTISLLLTNFGPTIWSLFLRGESVEEAQGLSGRLDVWQASVQKILEHPWIGYGGFAGSRFVVFPSSSTWSDALNSYVDSILDVGILGPIILIIVMLSAWVLLFRSARNSRLPQPERYLALEMLLVLLIVTVRSMESGNLTTHPTLSFLTAIGAAEFLRRRTKWIQIAIHKQNAFYGGAGPKCAY